ncbi:DNA polymerase III subunit gamma and tau [Arthrobacter sp. MMS18-M83]|uniref:DNA polymerase III subunit gamma and tau n=1 Tax=Arthrobacter sp. MMS18-M83 TaxID=2996261 RepID=UPI00227C1724|nr:DNA polymerase III subunit gamma and tau [Arthrobacter sp. MMS18-M83]WAH99382.1 DNA polymerase III subunit gamma and tau [Arthrobacter sp. MMS18-M83]
MTVTTALYRRYRPDSFADVIGQEHVTEPLMTALRKNRVNHAYLFSGPRGCGKTTSARILARCLNCAEGPTDTPCGKCNSCIELARGGSGSLDVIEIDAASHGGVDDARDLRERATFAPVRDRYKIFIIDEAHMVTSAGFNALLKIVEEPPEHIKFIFATTEPDKVIGTIRSRTHHYPFRLVPPEPLMKYLEVLCEQENVAVAPGVLSLVIRAGGGSVRDSLSVLDQLMAGAGPNGLDYELAVALLGYTHASLLDDVVEAIAASDSATVFRAVDRVIQTGHDPRRFVEDLLERFRDLIIVQAMPESAQAILRGMPADQIARMRSQANNLGAAELSRAADVTNTALTEMTGATSPRLHLELLCARILLPSSEQTERGIAARIDRVERRLNYGGALPPAEAEGSPAVAAVPSVAAAPPARPAERPGERPTAAASTTSTPPGSGVPAVAEAPVSDTPAVSGARPVPETQPVAETQPVSETPSREQLTPPRVSTNDWLVDEARQPASRPAAESATHTPVPAASRTEQPVAEAPAPSQAPAVPSPLDQERPQPAAAVAPTQAPASAPAQAPRPATGGADVEVIRRAWPEILQTLTKIKRSSWALVGANAQVAHFDGQLLTLAFSTGGLASAFSRADHAENLRQAIHKTIGIDCQITSVVGGNSSGSSEPDPKAPADPAPPVIGGASPTASSTVDSAWGLAPATQSVAAAPEAGNVDASQVRAPAPAVQARTAPATSGQAPSGLAPSTIGEASEQVQGSLPAQAPDPAPANQPVSAEQGSAPAAALASPTAEAIVSPEVPARVSATAALATPSAGSGMDYSYSDDDWGPPRDEDAPPLDEEPPMDWVPSAPPGLDAMPAAGTAAPHAATPQVAVSPADASGLNGSAAGTLAATSKRSPQATPVKKKLEAPEDPWSKAVEHAPGSWVVSSESNVGAGVSGNSAVPSGQTPPSGAATASPVYEPAAAQIPSQPQASAQAPAPASAPAAEWSATTAEWSTSVWSAPSPTPSSTGAPPVVSSPTGTSPTGTSPAGTSPTGSSPTAATPGGETRSAAVGLALSTAQAPGTAQTPVSAPSGTGKQSLYQRLSNSPEAMAGREKAPARAAAGSGVVVEDIPSADDETIEESGVFGRAAVERILGGKLLEERSLDGAPLMRR